MHKIHDHRLGTDELLRHHHWRLEAGESLPWHRHHFVEVFWIEKGEGWHETDDEVQPVEVGDLIFMPHGSVHRISAECSSLTWCNVIISSEIEAVWRQRYADDWQTWPWEELGYHWRLSESIHRQLSHTLMNLNPYQSSVAAIDQWFLSLWKLFHLSQSSAGQAPLWLSNAIDVIRSPIGLQEGVPALVRECGKSQDHVARVVKKCYGTSPSLLVREMRLDYAAALLRTTGDSVLHISLDCGFESPSYFARAFKERFGSTPRNYRQGRPAIGSMIL